MNLYEVGAPLPNARPPLREGFELRMQGGPALVLIFSRLTQAEVEAARRGSLQFGVCEENINRDVNAGLNILRMGRGVYPSADEQGLPLGESGEVAHARRPQKPPALAVG